MNDLGIYKVDVEVVSNEMTFDPSFVKTGLLVQKLKRTETHTHTQHCDAGVVLFFYLFKEWDIGSMYRPFTGEVAK